MASQQYHHPAQPDSNTFKAMPRTFGDAVQDVDGTSERTEDAEENLFGEEFDLHQTEKGKEEDEENDHSTEE